MAFPRVPAGGKTRHNSGTYLFVCMCTDVLQSLKVAAVPWVAACALAWGGAALADPVSASPSVPLSSSKEDVAAALRAAEGSERSVVDVFDADPAKEAAANAKAQADRRAALAALGLHPQSAQRQQAPSRVQGGGITDTGPYGGSGQGGRPGKDGGNPAAPQEVDPLKEAARPLYEEISKSGIADAMRGLKADLKAQLTGDKDKPADGTAGPAGAAAAAKPKDGEPTNASASTSDGGDGAGWGTPVIDLRPPPKTAAQAERDRMLAAASMEKLIADLQPWVITVLVLSGLFVAGRVTVRYLRGLEERRRRRRFSPSTHPRRSQF